MCRCGRALPGPSRNNIPRKFCSPSCKNAHYNPLFAARRRQQRRHLASTRGILAGLGR